MMTYTSEDIAKLLDGVADDFPPDKLDNYECFCIEYAYRPDEEEDAEDMEWNTEFCFHPAYVSKDDHEIFWIKVTREEYDKAMTKITEEDNEELVYRFYYIDGGSDGSYIDCYMKPTAANERYVYFKPEN